MNDHGLDALTITEMTKHAVDRRFEVKMAEVILKYANHVFKQINTFKFNEKTKDLDFKAFAERCLSLDRLGASGLLQDNGAPSKRFLTEEPSPFDIFEVTYSKDLAMLNETEDFDFVIKESIRTLTQRHTSEELQ